MTLTFDPTPVGDPPALDGTRVRQHARPVDAALREAFLARDAGTEALERLFADDALCVTSGQQPALFLGPLYTIHKAIGLIAMARHASRALARPVEPVFWIAGDDHDFAEANHVDVLDRENDVRSIVLRERPADAPLTPLYRERLGDAINDAITAVREVTPDTEFRKTIFEWLERHYHADQDFAGAAAGALAELFGPHGLVVFQSTHPAAKRAMAPRLLEALEAAPTIDAALQERADGLRGDNRTVPVTVGDGATLVMLEGPLGRDRLVMDGKKFATRRAGERFDLAALRAIADSEPERLSPNVLLRPAVEAALLPTAAYVAGPGELAYFPQTAPVYDALDIMPQAVTPRWSARVIETKVQKVLEKYGIAPDDLSAPEGQLEQRLVRDELPEAAHEALTALRRAIQEHYGTLLEAATGIDPTLKKPIQSAQNGALAGTRDAEKRIVHHLKQANEVLVQQLAKARNNLFPLGRPQERVLNVVPYLARYGSAYVEQGLAAAEAWLRTLEPTERDR